MGSYLYEDGVVNILETIHDCLTKEPVELKTGTFVSFKPIDTLNLEISFLLLLISYIRNYKSSNTKEFLFTLSNDSSLGFVVSLRNLSQIS